jgi:hypothetical protein
MPVMVLHVGIVAGEFWQGFFNNVLAGIPPVGVVRAKVAVAGVVFRLRAAFGRMLTHGVVFVVVHVMFPFAMCDVGAG